jgi:hypothetical protein
VLCVEERLGRRLHSGDFAKDDFHLRLLGPGDQGPCRTPGRPRPPGRAARSGVVSTPIAARSRASVGFVTVP